jgi:hypothetical protein
LKLSTTFVVKHRVLLALMTEHGVANLSRRFYAIFTEAGELSLADASGLGNNLTCGL